MYEFVNYVVRILKKIVPESVVRPLRPFYHHGLSFLMALFYGFPSRRLVVIGVTGTKGKSTVCEMLFRTLRHDSEDKVALLSTIRFAIEDDSEPNLYKMTLPARGFAQAFMRKALDAGCKYMLIELTSEAQLQYRTLHLALDGLVVTNIQKEHIERHGSFEKYVAAKRAIVAELERSPKKHRILVANADNEWTKEFLNARVTEAIGFSEKELTDLEQTDYEVSFTYSGKDTFPPSGTRILVHMPGVFTAMNALATIKMAEALGLAPWVPGIALRFLDTVPGRLERIDMGQDFLVVVDYAHTPDSLQALYGAFPNRRKICVLGNTGGGRDIWKRPEMGRIADEECEKVILTNEDPYDESPQAIVEAMARGMKRVPEIIMDRREAIRAALCAARSGDAVLISGKGTDPFIMGARGTRLPWSDAKVVSEELGRLLSKI